MPSLNALVARIVSFPRSILHESNICKSKTGNDKQLSADIAWVGMVGVKDVLSYKSTVIEVDLHNTRHQYWLHTMKVRNEADIR